jgi:hypothetical protein
MAFTYKELIKMARVPSGKKITLRKDFDPGFSAPGWSKETANKKLEEGIRNLAEFLRPVDSFAGTGCSGKRRDNQTCDVRRQSPRGERDQF